VSWVLSLPNWPILTEGRRAEGAGRRENPARWIIERLGERDREAKKIVQIVSVQNRYNLTDRDSQDVLNYCEKEKMGFMPGRRRGPYSTSAAASSPPPRRIRGS
jgi:hypothetical protein